VAWLGESDLSADEALAPAPSRGRESPEFAKANDFLRRALADGPQPARDVFPAAEAEGIAEKTLRRAKKAARVDSFRPDGDGWYWRLPATVEGGHGEHGQDGQDGHGGDDAFGSRPF
jgi:hypothetical protein